MTSIIALPFQTFHLKTPMCSEVTRKHKKLFSSSSWEINLPTVQICPTSSSTLISWFQALGFRLDRDSEVIQTWDQEDENHLSKPHINRKRAVLSKSLGMRSVFLNHLGHGAWVAWPSLKYKK